MDKRLALELFMSALGQTKRRLPDPEILEGFSEIQQNLVRNEIANIRNSIEIIAHLLIPEKRQ